METIYNADYSEVLTSTAVNNTRGFGGMYLDLYTGLYDDGWRIYTADHADVPHAGPRAGRPEHVPLRRQRPERTQPIRVD